MPSYSLPNILTSGQPFQFATLPANGSTPSKLFMKSVEKAYVFDGTTLTEVTDPDYPGKMTLTAVSITRVGAVATVTTPTNNFITGDSIVISGAVESDYNGTFVITVTSNTVFTYTVANAPTTPATGTILAKGGRTTVPGVVSLDGTIYVMDAKGQIYGSDILDPLTWDPLTFISANSEGDQGVAIYRHLNYVLAFKERSMEVLYDAGNPVPGSSLSKMTNALSEIGCASAGSLAFTDNNVYFMAASFPRGRSIMKMVGFTPTKVSTPFVERLLNADDLAGVYAMTLKSNGHIFYVLTLTTSNITLVYDEVTGEWHRWSFYTRNSPTACTTSTDANGLTTVTKSAHGLVDGDPIDLLGDLFAITYVSSSTFTVLSTQTVPATTTYTDWDENCFPPAFATRGSNEDLLLTVTGAKVLKFSPEVYQDEEAPINTKARTMVEDWGSMTLKSIRRLELVGDQLDATVLIRYTDDDYQSWSEFRPIPVNDNRAQLRRMGATRRRAHELRHLDDTPLRMIALEIDIDKGAR